MTNETETQKGIFDVTDLEKEITNLKRILNKKWGLKCWWNYHNDFKGLTWEQYNDKKILLEAILKESQRIKAEVEKSFNTLIKMFEDVNVYSDAQYLVIEIKKRLGI